MGFGLLFIGYFISTVAALSFPEIGGFTGYAVITLALLSLAEYDKRFGLTIIPAIPLALINLVLSAGVILEWFSIPVPSFITWMASYSDLLINSLKLVFTLMLCYSIRGIASDTGADKLCFPATRNMFLYAACFAVELMSDYLDGVAKYLVPVAMIVYLVTIFFNHVMIFSAYMNICDEKDVNMEIKKTNIKWYDKLVEKKAEQEQKAADSTKAYFEEKLAKRAQKQNKKSNQSSTGKKNKR